MIRRAPHEFKIAGLEDIKALSNMSSSPDNALDWVKQNIVAFLPATRIVGIAVGNEVLPGSDQELWGDLYGAVTNIYNATKQLNKDSIVQISTSHSSAVFNDSYPPSPGTFSSDLMHYMKPLLKLFSQIGSPLCLNAYAFLAYISDPYNIDINYAIFQNTSGIHDNVTSLHYDDMLDAQIDAAYVHRRLCSDSLVRLNRLPNSRDGYFVTISMSWIHQKSGSRQLNKQVWRMLWTDMVMFVRG